MGLILMGVATPSESADTGVVGSLIVAALFVRLSWAMLREAISSAVIIATVILIIVVSAKLFSQLLSFAGATRGLVTLIGDLAPGSPGPRRAARHQPERSRAGRRRQGHQGHRYCDCWPRPE
jgi:TRAP-type mannitol/chloroaromatic compound transport system permease large subunit